MHFTYVESSNDADLQQGDVLARSDVLCETIRTHHPYYLKSDYGRFIVLTQSCDLVRRSGNPPSAKYLTLAAVRPLNLALEREAKKYRSSTILKASNSNNQKNRGRIEQFLSRLLNNNHPEYFYLHEEPTLGIVERSCAFLRLSIALRAEEHYKTCLNARVTSLDSNFQSKLGWLVGNIYARVGTEDWIPKYKSAQEMRLLIDQILDETLEWFPDGQIREARKKIKEPEIENMTEEEIRGQIRACPNPKRKDQIIDIILNELSDQDLIESDSAEKARRLLRNSSLLASLFK